jgi:hypothetical protein
MAIYSDKETQLATLFLVGLVLTRTADGGRIDTCVNEANAQPFTPPAFHYPSSNYMGSSQSLKQSLRA